MSQNKQTGPRRDVRVDRIGFVSEVVKQYIEGADGLKSKLKGTMQPGEIVEGDFFFGRLDASTVTETTVSKAAIVKMFQKGELTRPQLIKLIAAIDVKELAKIVAPKVLNRLVNRKSSPGTPRLNVDRLPEVQCELVDAIRGLNDAILGGTAAELKRAA